MKTSNSISFSSSVPSLFQIAAFFEDFFPSGSFRQATPSNGNLPFAEIMVNPEKLMTLLKSGKPDVQAAIMAEQVLNQTTTKRGVAMKSAAPKKSRPRPWKTKSVSQWVTKANRIYPKIGFGPLGQAGGGLYELGDIPVEMMHLRGDIWSAVVPLAPGLYSYRFIVDGQWCDDPHSNHHVPNPFGGENAVIRVT